MIAIWKISSSYYCHYKLYNGYFMKFWNPQYKTLDHWRGIAALWVMIFHGFGTTFNKPLHPLAELVKLVAAPGWLGVHLFFVISGYCIAANLYKLSFEDGSLWTFIKNRFWRLMPTYWLALIMTIILNLISSPFNKTNLLDSFPSSLQSWLGNLLLIQPYLNVPFYVVVYWSLVVELGFYIIIASLLAIRTSINQNFALFIAISLGLASVFIPADPRLGLLNYWGEFLCGSLVFIALWASNRNHIYQRNLCLILIILLGSLGEYMNVTHNQQNQILFSSIFSIIIYFLYKLDKHIDSLYFIQWLKFTGVMSYSLYLLHVPFQGRVINLGSRFIPLDSPMMLLLQIFGWAVAISVSFMFYRLIEKPLSDWRHQRTITKPIS
ncbi:acyltransferase family protein [Nostoc sp.]|uniref:acyltransferase family protein n=1 Tax=Nostoc sp. TaxID=1180 RepID=UPI002FF94BD9